MQRLTHKIIVFTGPLAAGKTTVKKKLTGLLTNLKIPYSEILTLRDLELPFAVNQGLIRDQNQYSRWQVTKLMKILYAKYGRSLGSTLLYQYLKDKDKNKIYIIDSKRNPDGIKQLKKMFKNVIVVGVTATTWERIKRLKKRKRELDSRVQNPVSLFFQEEKIFNINQSLSLSDLLIENHQLLPNEIEVKIFQALVKAAFIHCKKVAIKKIHWSLAKKQKNSRGRLLKVKDVFFLLKDFAKKNWDKKIFVIQGGNRYIRAFLENECQLVTKEIKLVCLSKVKLSVILNSLLLIRERSLTLDEQQLKKIRTEFNKLPLAKQKNLSKKIKKQYSSSSLSQVLRYENLNGLINIFADFKINPPFAYPADDRKIPTEFKKSAAIIENEKYQIKNSEIIRAIFKKTEFADQLKGGKNIFVDDVFYRGRTMFTIAVLMKMFQISNRHWKLCVLCSDIKSQKIHHKLVEVLKPNFIYPFENSIKTERGYWQIKTAGNFFEFQNLDDYWIYLNSVNRHPDFQIFQDWQTLLTRVKRNISGNRICGQVQESLINIFIFHLANHLKCNIAAIVDQRGQDIGYCVAFANLIESFIPQEKSAWQRWQYKAAIREYLARLKNLDQKSDIIKEMVKFYAKNNQVVDYYYLKNFYS